MENSSLGVISDYETDNKTGVTLMIKLNYRKIEKYCIHRILSGIKSKVFSIITSIIS